MARLREMRPIFPDEVRGVHYGGVKAEGAHDAVDVAVGKIGQHEKRRKRRGTDAASQPRWTRRSGEENGRATLSLTWELRERSFFGRIHRDKLLQTANQLIGAANFSVKGAKILFVCSKTSSAVRE